MPMLGRASSAAVVRSCNLGRLNGRSVQMSRLHPSMVYFVPFLPVLLMEDVALIGKHRLRGNGAADRLVPRFGHGPWWRSLPPRRPEQMRRVGGYAVCRMLSAGDASEMHRIVCIWKGELPMLWQSTGATCHAMLRHRREAEGNNRRSLRKNIGRIFSLRVFAASASREGERGGPYGSACFQSPNRRM